MFIVYVQVVPLKDKKVFFNKTLGESGRKPNKIWAGEGSEFYNKSTKSCLQDNDREMYSTYNEVESVVPERLVRTLKFKVYIYMTSVSKNV